MGELYALLTAVIWAVAVILLRRSGETVSPFALNLFRVVVSTFLLLPTVSAFFALNFTGSTPFTSRSGVKREMRRSLPVMGLALVAGLVLLLLGVVR